MLKFVQMNAGLCAPAGPLLVLLVRKHGAPTSGQLQLFSLVSTQPQWRDLLLPRITSWAVTMWTWRRFAPCKGRCVLSPGVWSERHGASVTLACSFNLGAAEPVQIWGCLDFVLLQLSHPTASQTLMPINSVWFWLGCLILLKNKRRITQNKNMQLHVYQSVFPEYAHIDIYFNGIKEWTCINMMIVWIFDRWSKFDKVKRNVGRTSKTPKYSLKQTLKIWEHFISLNAH